MDDHLNQWRACNAKLQEAQKRLLAAVESLNHEEIERLRTEVNEHRDACDAHLLRLQISLEQQRRAQ